MELGFLTNPEEEDFLHSETGKSYLASAIYRAFRDNYLASRATDDSHPPSKDASPDSSLDAASEGTLAQDETPELPASEERDESPAVWFGVQILTTNQELSADSPQLRGHSEAKPYIRHGMHKYILGQHATPDEAHLAKTALRAEGFEDAFVVAFQGESQIPMSEARKRLNLPSQ